MGDRTAKNALFDGLADVARALGNGRRAELVDVLAQGERSVDVLAAEIDQSVANTSFHLRQLAATGLVATRRDGTRIHYRLASDRVRNLWAAMREVAEAHLAGLDDLAASYVGDRSLLETIDRDELVRRLDDSDLIVVDVRNTTEFGAGHIAGARSIPIDELARRVDELPPDVDVVAYCRGPYCAYADDAVRLLADRGRTARRLDGGFPEWRADGRPTDDAIGSDAVSG
jgi:rhodanese-related sulfurtransferase/DNA-binding transcriptional ArsR family regulator